MPPIQIAYLALVVAVFVALGVSLAWASWWSNRPAAPRRRQVSKPSAARSRAADASSHARPAAS